MRTVISLFLGMWALFSFSGCSDLLSSLREDSAAADRQAEDEDPDYATKPHHMNGLSANNVQSYSGRRLASRLDSNNPNVPGDTDDNGGDNPVYSAPQREYHRVTKDDFVDKQTHENSLWDGQGQGNYLFTNNRKHEVGDMLTGEVEKDLRREIQYQLWLTLPPDQRRAKRQPASTDGDSVSNAAAAPANGANPQKSPEDKAKDAAAEAAKTNMAPASKEDDIVRMEVVESMGNGLVRAVGQKRVIYKGQSRVVEIEALVNNKDIDDSGHVKSSNFVDMKAQVVQ